ncbi:Uncharacterized protein SCF082_LOCUS44969 [Durusdinium trenchii]|uniref:Phytanoyl-CoA dioxygenase n=1 Tax=Durusdinium trenchii TaxID=1381693 RepID=A0ABP0R689_9DINO
MFGSIHKKEFVFLTSSLDTSLLTRTCDGQHKHIQSKWSKPSAVYTDELAAALGQSFDKALTKKIRGTQSVEPKLKGLESPLCNDVLLSAKWKVDKVWSWRSPKHINIQEVLAAERLMKEQAVSWPKSRFPVVMDSNVGMSALVKGRSPSDGLRPALRRAGSTIVAGALYPAYHFGPTRLLPADHPTRDNEFPPPCRSCRPPEATCTELLQFSKVSNLARKGANWVRLVLLLLQDLPLWSQSKDSWRFAHVSYKHCPFGARGADFNQKEFDSACGYPGEGPAAGGSRVQLMRCLASAFPLGIPALVRLLGALAALVGIFGACISFATFVLTSALPRKAVPVRVRSRPRPRSSSLTLFRQAKLQALLLAILFLEHPGLVAGAPRHGLKLQPRDAADRARQETRGQLELPDGRPVLGQTQRQRDKLIGAFEEWLRSQGILLDEILMVGAPDVEALNLLLERYGRELYRAGRPYGHYSETVNAVSAKRPRVRRLLQPAWDLAYSWLRQEPPVHHLALPWQAMLSFLTTSLCWGWCRVAGIIALSWGGITRIGESVNAFRRDLVLPSDVNYTIDYVLLQIAGPKTRFRCARHQMAKVDQPQLVRIIVTAFENLRPDQRLWPASGSTIRSRFQRLVQANSLDHLRTKKGLDLGSLRAGGASWLLMTSDNPDMTRRRGRWINAKVMEVYVQEAWAVQFLPQLPKSIKEGIMEGAGLFPWALELAEIWKRAAVPESAWPILYQKAARDLEQQEMGRQHLEKEEAGDGGAAFVAERLVGHVQRYSEKNGFGFIACPACRDQFGRDAQLFQEDWEVQPVRGALKRGVCIMTNHCIFHKAVSFVLSFEERFPCPKGRPWAAEIQKLELAAQRGGLGGSERLDAARLDEKGRVTLDEPGRAQKSSADRDGKSHWDYVLGSARLGELRSPMVTKAVTVTPILTFGDSSCAAHELCAQAGRRGARARGRLRARLWADGYLFLRCKVPVFSSECKPVPRGLLPSSAVQKARLSLLRGLQSLGLLAKDTPLEEGKAAPKSAGKAADATADVRSLASSEVLALLNHPEPWRYGTREDLFLFLDHFLNSPAQPVFDSANLRAVLPQQSTGFHTDSVYMGRLMQQPTELLAVWIPVTEIPLEMGGLVLCRGSNSHPGFEHFRATYGRLDLDEADVGGSGWFTEDPREAQRSLRRGNRRPIIAFGGQMETAHFRPGDVVLFTMHSIHGSSVNCTDRYRLSMDFRVRAERVSDVEQSQKKGRPE